MNKVYSVSFMFLRETSTQLFTIDLDWERRTRCQLKEVQLGSGGVPMSEFKN